MFGLTKREQRWKAEQKAAETVLALVGTVVRAAADARIAEANAEAEELARLREENARLRAATASAVVHTAGERTASIEGAAEGHSSYGARPDVKDDTSPVGVEKGMER